MRPRLIAVDDLRELRDQDLGVVASMRPRLIAVDDVLALLLEFVRAEASMRPRLIAVDDLRGTSVPGSGRQRFNEATAYCRG